MQSFLQQHAEKITGILSCFDRLIFKGYLPFTYPRAMEAFLQQQQVLLKDFRAFALDQSQKLKEHAQALAAAAGRPYIYLEKRIRKEDEARRMAAKDGVTQGLVCVFAKLESCSSFKIAYGKGRPRLKKSYPRCLVLYFYYLDPEFGLLPIRLPTWFPFTIQVYANGHDWLAHQLDKHAIGYRQHDNAFLPIDNLAQAQALADQLTRKRWPRFLNVLARRVHPLLNGLLQGQTYNWVTDQCEFATDVLFKDRQALQSIYPRLLEHATLQFSAEDILSFLGKKLDGRFKSELTGDLKKRPQGYRIKHCYDGNWIKMYDKASQVLRVEMVINRPRRFYVRGQVPIDPEHKFARMLTSANRSRTGLSVLEAPIGQPIIYFQDLRLAGRILAPQAVEKEFVPIQIHVTTNQPVGPHLAQRPRLSQKADLTAGVASPQVDQAACGSLLQVEFPVGRESTPVWSRLDPRRSLSAQGRDVLLRMPLQVDQGLVLEAGPDLGLPPTVVALDHGLKAGLTWWYQHRNDSQAQAQAEDTPQGIGVTVGTMKNHVVVKLSVAGQADLTPVRQQRLYGHFRGDRGDDRPGNDQASMQGNAIENFYLGAVVDDQSFNDVKAIQFGVPSRHLGQIPAARRRRPPGPPVSVQSSTAGQNTVNGSQRRHRVQAPLHKVQKGLADGLRTNGPQVAVGQFRTDSQNQILQGGFGASGLVGRMRTVGPINAVQALAFGPLDPVSHGSDSDTELASHRAKGWPWRTAATIARRRAV